MEPEIKEVEKVEKVSVTLKGDVVSLLPPSPRSVVTTWEPMKSKSSSQYGDISYIEWCKSECRRVWKTSNKVWRVLTCDGKCAVERT